MFVTRVHCHVTRYTCHSPEILILKIGTVTPAENLQRYEILTCLDVFGYIETGLKLTVLAVSDLLSIDPYSYIRGSRTDAQEDILTFPLLSEVKGSPILSGIIMLQSWVRRIVCIMSAPSVSDILIDRIAIAVKFPHSRNRHLIPVRIDIVSLEEIQAAGINSLVPGKFPHTA